MVWDIDLKEKKKEYNVCKGYKCSVQIHVNDYGDYCRPCEEFKDKVEHYMYNYLCENDYVQDEPEDY